MKISTDTLAIFKNFASINSNIIVKPGNVLRTFAHDSKAVYGEAKVAETFPVEFGIWELNKFLATVSLFKDPDFEFLQQHVVISSTSSNARISYYYSNPELLTAPPKTIKMPETKASFDLNTKDLSELQKAANVLQVPDLALIGSSEGLTLRVFDKKDDTCNTYEMNVGDNPANLEFKALFKMENLKIVPGTYHVRVSPKGISEFSNANGNLTYWIALESDSRWN